VNVTKLSDLCDSVSAAISAVRQRTSVATAPSECLDAMWCLQDHLERLLDALSDFPDEASDFLHSNYSDLTDDIHNVLAFVSECKVCRNTVVAQSQKAIAKSLSKIAALPQMA